MRLPILQSLRSVTHKHVEHVPKRVLVVEDDQCLQSVLIEIIQKISPEIVVECVTNAHAGARLIHYGHLFDLVLCDINLPGGCSGCDLWWDFRSRYPLLNFIFMSSIPVAEYRERIAAVPCPPFLQKPFTVDEASRVICEALKIDFRRAAG